jgi:hypothetical protein
MIYIHQGGMTHVLYVSKGGYRELTLLSRVTSVLCPIFRTHHSLVVEDLGELDGMLRIMVGTWGRLVASSTASRSALLRSMVGRQ